MTQSSNGKRIIFFRPVFYIAIFLTFGILVGYYLTDKPIAAIVLACISGLIALIDIVKNKKMIPLVLYLAAFGFGVVLISINTTLDAIPAGETAITGRIVDAKHYEYSSYYTLDDWSAENGDKIIQANKKIRIKTDNHDLAFGDVVRFRGVINYPKTQRNLFGFDSRQYLLSKGIGYEGTVAGDIKVIDSEMKLDSLFYRARQYIEKRIDAGFSQATSGIAKGLILGDKSDISDEVYNAYRTGGAASILAVSGLHFGVVSLFFFWLLRLVGIGRKPANLMTGIIMLFYAGVVGFSVSAVRALIMGWVIIAANLLGKRKDYLSVLCAAYILSLLIRPISLFTAGFVLSFGAVFSIVLLTEPLIKLMKPLPKVLSGAVATTFSASIGTAPIIINFFNYVSIIGLFANLVMIPIASIAVVLVLLSVMLGSTIGGAIAFLADKLILMMNAVMHGVQSIPFASITLKNLPIIFIIFWFLLIFLLSNEVIIKRKFKAILTGSIAVIMTLAFIFIPINKPGNLQIYFFDVGQGDAIFIQTPEQKNYMIDTGRAYQYNEIERYLLSSGYTLDGLFLTHADDDHVGGYRDLIESDLVNRIYIAKADKNAYDFGEAAVIRLSRGEEVFLSDTVRLDILNPEANAVAEFDNQLSLCMRLTYRDYRVLFTGDIDDEIEDRLKYQWNDIDVLKVAHHGSKYGSTVDFLKKTKPKIAVIQCGENIYGHPSAQTLYNLESACDIIYRTDQNGGISITLGDDIIVDTVID